MGVFQLLLAIESPDCYYLRYYHFYLQPLYVKCIKQQSHAMMDTFSFQESCQNETLHHFQRGKSINFSSLNNAKIGLRVIQSHIGTGGVGEGNALLFDLLSHCFILKLPSTNLMFIMTASSYIQSRDQLKTFQNTIQYQG